VQLVPCDHTGELDPVQVCRELSGRGVQTVLLEGGPRLAGAWWAAGAIDKVAAFLCPVVLSGERALAPLSAPGAVRVEEGTKLQEVGVTRIGCDVLITGYVGGPY
jgi:diaminohydroxyphosphoribosylaminopyrimidine deaminase/5-amino-6-(5-phosphoribosylamino)uracil reductase